MIAIVTMSAVIQPCSSRVTATASAPVMVSPTSGMNEPRKISTPSAAASGTRRTSSTMVIDTPWNSAMSSCPRMYPPKVRHPTRPAWSSRVWAARGNRRTAQAQISSPSRSR